MPSTRTSLPRAGRCLSRLLEVARRRERGLGAPSAGSAFEHFPDAVLVLDDEWCVQAANAAAAALLGDVPGGWNGRSLLDAVVPADDVVVADGPGCDVHIPRADGTTVTAELRVRDLLDDPTVRGLIVSLRDVSERRQVEEELRRQALVDPLTGVGNRLQFTDRLRHAVTALTRSDELIAVLFVDLDDFKGVNDRFGHVAGDHVLVEVARRIRAAVRPSDTVARVGGDEFVVLVERVDDPVAAHAIAARIEDAIAQPFIADRELVRIGASVGVACAPDFGSAEQLLDAADADMYRQKTAAHLVGQA